MTAEQFEAFWESTYPLSVPLSHFMRVDYADRWFRIHSLPESQRYPNNEVDWAILLSRQNSLISDLVGNNSILLLVTGEYNFNSDENEQNEFIPDSSLSSLNFTSLNSIELAKSAPDPLTADEYLPGEVYRPVVAEIDWRSGKYDDILKDVAFDKFRVLLISVKAECVIAPYDGGSRCHTQGLCNSGPLQSEV